MTDIELPQRMQSFLMNFDVESSEFTDPREKRRGRLNPRRLLREGQLPGEDDLKERGTSSKTCICKALGDAGPQ